VELVMKTSDILCFGECMLELSRSPLGTKSWDMGVAGDSYNVAVYMQRLGLDIGYMTALGADSFSNDVKAHWHEEGLSADWSLTHETRNPGLYAIRLDAHGERSFSYWRDQSAARAFFDCDGFEALWVKAREAQFLYLSGITLSLFNEEEQLRIRDLAQKIRSKGGRVAFDSNYRPKGWPDKAAAQLAIKSFAPHVDITLPTLEDDAALFDDANEQACAQRWHDWGVGEVAVKLGRKGAFVSCPDTQATISALSVANVRDTTGAGDSFNAAYLASRFTGHSPIASAEAGCQLAATVVQHAGAIIGKEHMPSIFIAEKAPAGTDA
jgi:2-dehydro-3-deoxygluconokinase